MKIEFDFEEIKGFIDDSEEEHIGRCGDRYFTKYKLLEDGRIRYKNYSWSRNLTEDQKKWKYSYIKGVIIK